MTLVAVRHLPTLWNKAGVIQGQNDISILPPDAKQQLQIHQARERLERYGPFELVLCSRLRRTRQTALAYGYPLPSEDKLLDEFHFGPYEGVPKAQLESELGDAWLHRPDTLTLGEAISELEARIRRFLVEYSKYERLLIFGHGCWLRALKALHDTGSIRPMNQMTIENNRFLVLTF